MGSRLPGPIDCDDDGCDHEIVFKRHYDRSQWDDFVKLVDKDRPVPGAGVKYSILMYFLIFF